VKDGDPALEALWEREGKQERLVVLKDQQGRPYKKHIADVRDIVLGLLAAFDKPAAIGETFQLGGPVPFTWDEAVPYLSERLGIPYVEAVSGGVPTYYEYDIGKARDLLGFRPAHDMFRMIDDALAFRRGETIGVLPTT
jgi:UDP-glucose 4-epimerase